MLGLWKYQQDLQTSSKTEKEKRKTQITNIKNETEDITTDSTDIKRIIRVYSEKLFTINLTALI